jgi:uncharacterized peroxidase-related enzyme
MPFIDTTPPREAQGDVRAMYERQQAKYGYVPNYAKVFSHRPEIMTLWADLLYGIRRNLDKRRFELATVAAALTIRSTYCSLAHGEALGEFYSPAQIRAIVADAEDSPLTPADKAMVRFARKIARHATEMTAEDTEALKRHGFTDAEIFDIAAAATARVFFAQLCEGLGATADPSYGALDATLQKTLVVGRPIDNAQSERLE